MEALTGEEWNGVRIFEEAQQGNELCSKVIQTFYEELAFGVFNVQHMLDPEMILFGGQSVHEGISHSESWKRMRSCRRGWILQH